MGGFEPSTRALRMRCSTTELHRPILLVADTDYYTRDRPSLQEVAERGNSRQASTTPEPPSAYQATFAISTPPPACRLGTVLTLRTWFLTATYIYTLDGVAYARGRLTNGLPCREVRNEIRVARRPRLGACVSMRCRVK